MDSGKYVQPFWVLLFTLIFQSRGSYVERKFEPFHSNCNITGISVHFIGSRMSLLTCAALCTYSSACEAFAWKHEDCGAMEKCPQNCSTPIGGVYGWDIHCPISKYMYSSTSTVLWVSMGIAVHVRAFALKHQDCGALVKGPPKM